MKTLNFTSAIAILLALESSWGVAKIDINSLPVETAVLTHAPEVPPPISRKKPARVKIHLETREVVKKLTDGVDYTFWTFGGSVPGPFMRIREGDYVDFTLANHPSSKMPHNIDLHAVTGQGGGAEGSFTAPGHSSTFSFRALNPGLYIYHCATAPVGMHIANGMYGLILVEPEKGLPPVDKEFYVVQSEFYTKGKYGARGLQPFDMQKAISENPDYVVFNGSVGALTNDNALKAKAGDNIRIFVGNGGPGLVSSFHVIGEVFDQVYTEGGTIPNQKNVQTTLVPAGGASIVEFKTEIPATLILVDHSIFRAFNKGALGMLKVEGEKDVTIYSGKTEDKVYMPEGGAIQEIPVTEKKEVVLEKTLAQRMEAGAAAYQTNCAACHQLKGEGIPNAFPPLAKSDYLMKDKKRAIGAVVNGLTGDIVVNGKTYNGVMPSLGLSDDDVANVLTFVRNSFGNKSDLVTIKEVKAVRGK
jgi:nitrite reductase (NO-forming)